MSLGIRSGVNWMRLNWSDSAWESVLISSVFASPGTPTSRMCPPAKSAISTSSITASCPTMTLRTSERIFSRPFWHASTSSASRSVADVSAVTLWESFVSAC